MKPVPEREAAKAVGERFYNTGKPCRNGHLSKRYTATGICAACAVKNTLAHQAKQPWHPARIAAKEAGLRHFSIGTLCKHGHLDKKFVANGICVQCSIERCAKWLKARPGYEAAAVRTRRAKNPHGHRAASKRWAQKNILAKQSADKAWRDANRAWVREYGAVAAQNRRTKLARNGGTFTCDDVAMLRLQQNGCCNACGRSDVKLEVDHIVAVVSGGSNDPSNLQLLCSPCNKSKGCKDYVEWLRLRETH